MNLVLASKSPYRAQLLAKLNLPFVTDSPDIDEQALTFEVPPTQALRLALEKASIVQNRHPTSVVIGSDQMAVIDDQVLGKPGTLERAKGQLRQLSGREVHFLTSLCVLAPGKEPLTTLDTTKVWFRELSEDEIDRYVDLEQPIDCAGAFKAEALGISLFSRLQSDDPNALIGMPLIALANFLRTIGYQVP